MRKARQLVLIPTSFPDPSSFERNFIAPELPHLLEQFEQVHLLPCKSGRSSPREFPGRIILNLSLAERLGFPAKFKLLKHAVSGMSVQKKFPTADSEPALPPLRALANYANLGMAQVVLEVLDQGVQDGTWPLDQTVFYSYWCKYSALGIAWTKLKYPGLKAATRAHRGDLYTSQAPYQLITRHGDVVEGMDRVFPISEDGARYLKARFPQHRLKIEVARLGTLKPEGRAHCSTDGAIRLVSCSRATALKRLDHIAHAAIKLAERQGRLVEWTHFGDGPELPSVHAFLARNAPANLRHTFKGNQTLEVIIGHYLNQPCDVFINSSRSEGIPVSMMEAMSTGVPCVAPSIGGIPELLEGDAGGVLVCPQAKPEDLAQACLGICDGAEGWNRRSDLAYRRWATHYNAAQNFRAFADSLAEL